MRHAREDYQRIQDPAGLIPEDEPVFLIRGKDAVAPKTVVFWAQQAALVGAEPKMIAAALGHADAMRKWQSVYGGQVPDLPPPNHVAAMEAQTGEGCQPDIATAPAVPAWWIYYNHERPFYFPGVAAMYRPHGVVVFDSAPIPIEEACEKAKALNARLSDEPDPPADFVDGVEPAIQPAPEQTVSKRQLESLVEDAFRFDAPHLTAYRIGKRVAEGLGFKVVEEG